jgi:hypothetical protein
VERSVELYVCVQFLVIGLSHVLQPRAWVEFFVLLRGWGRPGVFANGFLSLIFGAVIVGFHNVWSGWPMVFTLIGWAQIVKATVAFTMPHISMRSLQRVSPERAWEFQVAGAVFLVITAVMTYVLLI